MRQYLIKRAVATKWLLSVAAVFVCSSASSWAAADDRAPDDLSQREERAMQAAVEAVAPSVVRIETLGGLENVGGVLIGTGPTTGLIVSPHGHIISSAFNFVQKPAQILVYLNDGTRLPAKLISTDHSRKLVLLKVELSTPGIDSQKNIETQKNAVEPPRDTSDSKKPEDSATKNDRPGEKLDLQPVVKVAGRELPLPQAAPVKEMVVGQWTMAVGRTFGDGSRANMSVGVLSAMNRIWSKALQTDAKVSPSNYGGPLIDIRGRVMGVLVPLSQDGPGGGTGDIAGVEWYDSGIGFAVPFEQITANLPRMMKESELHSGLMGISLKGADLYTGDAVIGAAPGGSPANLAGLKAGDKIVEIDGVKITRQSELKHALGPRYAGETVKVVVVRDKDRIERAIELVAKLTPFQHPFLGILPLRDLPAQADAGQPAAAQPGLGVRYVYPNSPAAAKKIQPGDRIISVEGKPVQNRNALIEQLASVGMADEVDLEVRRGQETLKLKLKPTTLPEAIPTELPVAHGEQVAADGDKPTTGLINIKIPEVPNTCIAYVPESYQSNTPHGVVLWLHPPGGYKDDELIEQWKTLCAKHDLILLAPKSNDVAKWQRTELEFVRKTLDDLMSKYNIDRRRVAVVGQEGGGAMAYLLAFANRDQIQAVVAIDAALPRSTQIPSNDPVFRQAFFITNAKQAAAAKGIEATVEQLRTQKFPVTVKDLGDSSRPLTVDELAELARWIDSLDRI